jgi:hypothetical protein
MRNEQLTVVRAGHISGVVGHLAGPPRQTPRNLRAYHRAIARLSDAVSALLPVRFGTTFPSEAEVVALLRARTASFKSVLARVRGRVQMTVRFVSGEQQVPPVDERASASDRSSGTAYLRARALSARRLARWEPCVALSRVAGKWIRAELIEERHGVVSVYHLIPRAAAAHYRRVVEAGLSGLRPQVTGPFPPFAFADPLGAARESAPVPSRPRGSHG